MLLSLQCDVSQAVARAGFYFVRTDRKMFALPCVVLTQARRMRKLSAFTGRAELLSAVQTFLRLESFQILSGI